jgi:hypothetical protein
MTHELSQVRIFVTLPTNYEAPPPKALRFSKLRIPESRGNLPKFLFLGPLLLSTQIDPEILPWGFILDSNVNETSNSRSVEFGVEGSFSVLGL